MNITKIKVNLTGDDLLSIYNEFISVEGLEVKRIEINEDIVIVGTLKKGFNIDFLVSFKFVSIENSVIRVEVSRIKVLNIGIVAFVKNMAIKYLLKSFQDKGITYEKGKVAIQYKYILKDIPYIDFDIKYLFCHSKSINVEIENVQVSTKGAIKKEVVLITKKVEMDHEDERSFEKVEDYYTTGRKVLSSKLPERAKKYSDYLFILPDIITLIYRLLKDKRVPMKTKIVMSASICYTAIPSDIIPDKIPFVGKVDDLAVVFFALNKVIKDVPAKVILENWEGKNNIVTVLKTLAEYITDFTGAKNVETIYSIIDEIVSI